MQRKIFLTFDIPEKIKNRLRKVTEKWQDLPVKWSRQENLHLAISFLGYIDEANLLEIGEIVREVAQNYNLFDLEFQEIALFPSAEQPQKIILKGKNNEQLKNLVNHLEKELELTLTEKKTFIPYITLGRIKKNKWQKLKEKPLIQEKFPAVINAMAVDILANNFKETKNRYVVIESCPLH